MDVRISLSVSLLRVQLGNVIEQAVSNAVETVLEEMLKVVGCKFEEFGKEITAKEKENDGIRKMLEISRCQMKTMRKYLSAVSAKDERHVPVNQRKFGKQSESNRTLCPYGGEFQPLPNINQTRKGDDRNFTVNGRTQRLFNDNQIASLSEGLARATQLRDGTVMKDQELAVRESQDTRGSGPNVHHEEHRVHLERPDGCHNREGICDTEPSQGGSTEILDFDNPSLHKLDNVAMATVRASPQAKEEAEMQLICIKEEPPELETRTPSPQPPDHLRDHCRDQASRRDRAGPAYDPMGAALTAMSSSACWAGQQQAQRELIVLQPQQQQQRVELKRHGQLCRREREKSLPQPLQAALERERREKTRIRVARWRAKRKMQAAGLMTSQPTHLNYQLAQTMHMHADEALRCRQQYGSLLYSSPHCENSGLYPPLQSTTHAPPIYRHLKGHPFGSFSSVPEGDGSSPWFVEIRGNKAEEREDLTVRSAQRQQKPSGLDV
ncbi:hypothetical protein SKAU_G00254400 [Synaphobranchus kaupii]|uniref:Uncharacterized protein n=1 Tax=Synaphobranchus kaupii TaxID=118154 RepID=A0A9Q1F3H0_SYNKA|nr:hypothetical protein SKAU_G00254400 [Synaphobranchus kaupii]